MGLGFFDSTELRRGGFGGTGGGALIGGYQMFDDGRDGRKE